MTREQPTEEQRDEAALWLARKIGGSFGPGDAEKLEIWLNADRRHRRAFDELRVLYAQLEAPAQRVAAKHPLRRKVAARLKPRWNWIMPPAVALVMLGAIWWADPSLVQNWQADIVTAQEVVSDVTLPDGSLARLGADTAMALDFHNGQRQVHLLRGEAYFEVRHGLASTFTVVADGNRVRDVGTKFNVDLDNDQTEVAVSEGAVEVTGGNDPSSLFVREGNQVSIADGRVGHVQQSDPQIAFSWLTGRLVVQGARVDDVVRTLQRHTSGRIVVRGGLAARQISGTFPLTDVDKSLATIASAVDGRVVRVTKLMTILY